MKFEKFAIAEEIKDNLIANGFFRTTDIQYKTIPAILNGEDVLAIAQTGTGKTAAFAIPIINQIHSFKTSKRSRSLKCLVMVPTRELAKQIGEVFSKLARHTKASCYAIYGGVEQDPQVSQLEGGIDILIATPGRMFELIRRNHLDISGVSYLVLDEADRMLDLGFIDDIEQIKRMLMHRHQTLFFSATINTKIKRLAYSQIRANALRIQISPEGMVNKNITHSLAKVAMDEKRHLLANFIKDNADIKCIVFVRTQVRAQRVVDHLAKNGVEVNYIHGGMDQDERERNMAIFRNKKSGFLIATDVTARGIDLPNIKFVVNYDLPDDPENYVHRIGRTGRGFEKGEAISFCAPEETEKLKQIEAFLETKITLAKIDAKYLEEPMDNSTLSFAEMIEKEEARFGYKVKIKKSAIAKAQAVKKYANKKTTSKAKANLKH
jgi:ATP-dependent RNA helicase RhlE